MDGILRESYSDFPVKMKEGSSLLNKPDFVSIGRKYFAYFVNIHTPEFLKSFEKVPRRLRRLEDNVGSCL